MRACVWHVSQFEVVNWWGAMASAWSLVRAYEAMRPSDARFDRVVFSRPDVKYETGMGPWCGYRNDTWYVCAHARPSRLFGPL